MEIPIASLEALLETPEPAALGPSPRAGRHAIPTLEGALEPVFAAAKFTSQKQTLIRALIFLWHDHLDEAHTLSQEVPNSDGTFIHGLMHRREPDYGNAKYWFHRVGPHPAFKSIAQLASAIPAPGSERALLERFCSNGKWDSFALVDCCQEYCGSSSPAENFLKRIQKTEFRGLLAHLAE